jgi:hypothetical protein
VTQPIDRDRRRPLPHNHVFEAHDWHDPTNWFLHCFRDDEDKGVFVNFCSDPDGQGGATIRSAIWIDADQCEQFGTALLAAAKLSRLQV